MAEELVALSKSQTWELVCLPPGKSTIRCKWVFNIKTKADGTIEHCKARLVAKGCNQEYGVDYDETFVPIDKMTFVHILLIASAIKWWRPSHMDAKNAFFNGFISKEIYMKPPPSLCHHPSSHAYRLRRAL